MSMKLKKASIHDSELTTQLLEKSKSMWLNASSINKMYGELDLSKCPLFTGNFINFGYWTQSIEQDKIISLQERLESEKALYRLLMNELDILTTDLVLEIGCGIGTGGVLVFEEFQPKKIIGIDFCDAQIQRAKKINKHAVQKSNFSIMFQNGTAENLSFSSNSFEKVFSIEAAQHFTDIKSFVGEVYRVLKPGGRFGVATFFGTQEDSNNKLKNMFETVKNGIDVIYFIKYFLDLLKDSGFKNIYCKSIGEKVWPGFDKWISQINFNNTNNKNWYLSFKEGLLDYFIIVAEK